MELFRDYLDILCRSRGVQYAELARRVGVTKSYIGQLVHGHSKPPPPDRCEQLAEALELPPADRRRLVELAIRERARNETRVKLEELDSDLQALRNAVAELLTGLLDSFVTPDGTLPENLADLVDADDLLAGLFRVAVAHDGNPHAALVNRLADVPAERIADVLTTLGTVVRTAPERIESPETSIPARPPIPLIGHVSAGETNLAFTDAGLPAGASLPGEEPIPRWPGTGEHVYALRIAGESMMPLCPPGTIIVVDPDRTPRPNEPAICQTTEGKSYFKLVHFESGGGVRLVSTNQAIAPDIVLKRAQIRRLQKVVATIYP